MLESIQLVQVLHELKDGVEEEPVSIQKCLGMGVWSPFLRFRGALGLVFM